MVKAIYNGNGTSTIELSKAITNSVSNIYYGRYIVTDDLEIFRDNLLVLLSKGNILNQARVPFIDYKNSASDNAGIIIVKVDEDLFFIYMVTKLFETVPVGSLNKKDLSDFCDNLTFAIYKMNKDGLR